MRLLELSLPTPAENLALDEALLEAAETAHPPRETLRLWESDRPLVVVGRSSQLDLEVHETQCQQRDIPILRRASGGASIVAGPGCLMYAVLLNFEIRPELRSIERAHAFVLQRLAAALTHLVPGVERRGTSDLAVDDCKFSGNSLRCKKRALLYHGTLLYDFPLELVGQCLRMPPRVPEYRAGRTHSQFIMNLPIARETLASAVAAAFGADDLYAEWPQELTRRLANEKYSDRDWNYQR